MKRWSRRQVDRLQNVLIVLLACVALFLIGKTGFFDIQNKAKQPVVTASAGIQNTALARSVPVSLLVQNSAGRYGVQYQQERTQQLYRDGFEDFLIRSLASMVKTEATTREECKQAIALSEAWVCYDFLYTVSFSEADDGDGRFFLVTAKAGRADMIYFYNDLTGEYFRAYTGDPEISLPDVPETLEQTGSQFIFESDAQTEVLPGMLWIPTGEISSPVYTAANPLAELDETGRTAILNALAFNSRVAFVYETVDGTVIQEGEDSLRIYKNGTLTFHGAEEGEVRFESLSARKKDVQIEAEKVLHQVMSLFASEGSMVCCGIKTEADGRIELAFCPLLNGIPVKVWGEPWSAHFTFQGSRLTAFEIRLRQYTKTKTESVILPWKQAMAAAKAMGQGGKEWQLYYKDNAQVELGWMLREKESLWNAQN